MKKKKLLFLMVLLHVIAILIISCDKNFDFLEIDCSECYSNSPENGELIINVTINNENPEVPIAIYRDRIESGRIRINDTITQKTVCIEVPLNHYYSVTAKYMVGNDSVLAIDGERIKSQRVTGQCDTVCWIIKGGRYDLRLKGNVP